MIRKRTWTAVSVFVVLGLWVLALNTGRVPLGRGPSGGEGPRLLPLRGGEVEALYLHPVSGAVECRRTEGGSWVIVRPVAAEADQGVMAEILEYLGELRARRKVEGAPETDHFGLASPRIRAAVTYGSGLSDSLHIGELNPDGTSAYARVTSRPGIWLVEAEVISALSKDLFDLRDKQLMVFDPRDVSSIQFGGGASALRCVRTEQGDWRLLDPREMRASPTRIMDILWSLRKSLVRGFPYHGSHGALPRDHGLKPAVRIEMDGDEIAQVLMLGGTASSDTQMVYARSPRFGETLLVDSSLKSILAPDFTELRDSRVMRLEIPKVVGLELDSREGKLTVTRTVPGYYGQWVITSPVAGDAEPRAIVRLLKRLHYAVDHGVVAAVDFSPADFGLDAPRLVVRVWEESKPMPSVLSLGNTDAESGDVYARVINDKEVVLVRNDLLVDLSNQIQSPPILDLPR